MLLALLLFYDDGSLDIEIILFFKDVKQGWIGSTIDTNLLELVSEVILDWLLLECVSLQDDIVLALEHETV